ncbi:MAG: glutamate--tRNA ligase family protein [Candidatus Limnocylindrales bacterium]
MRCTGSCSRRRGRSRPGIGTQAPPDRRCATTAEGFGTRLATAIEGLPRGLQTRFAPAPTGYLHLGHVANALVVWGVARATRGVVVLRIEDHDRQRCRPEYETALLADIEALGFSPDEPPVAWFRDGRPSPWRQSDNDRTYATAAARLGDLGATYACDCSRTGFGSGPEGGAPWRGPGCPGGCATRGLSLDLPGVAWRVALGDGSESWTDLVLGEQDGEVASRGDLAIRDREGNWTYALCVVVDDLRHGIDLVIRGEDLLDATPAQVRLGALLGRAAPLRYLHHPLVRSADGRKLSKAHGDTAVRGQLEGGLAPATIRQDAAIAIGLDPGP